MVCREVWFDEEWSREGADLALLYHWSRPPGGLRLRSVHSLEIDLSAPEEKIWGGFGSSTRNQINRAKRDEIACQCRLSPNTSELDDFFSFLKRFSTERGFGMGEPLWMRHYGLQGSIAVSCASAGGNVLVWHSYYRGREFVRQLHSVSLFAEQDSKELRNRIGRANRLLHWADMLEFRKSGIRCFDFGGWYAGTTDQKLLRVNSFKEEFGGRKTERYHSTIPITLKAKLFLKARNVLNKQAPPLHWV